MAVIVETEEKETLPSKNSHTHTPKTASSSKNKKKKGQIEEKTLLRKNSDIRRSLDELNKKKEIGTNEQRDSGWCSKKVIKKPDEVFFFFFIYLSFCVGIEFF